MKETTVLCPTCGNNVVWNADSKYRPFCSERCRLIDLGEWASGNYRIASQDSAPGDDQSEDDPAEKNS